MYYLKITDEQETRKHRALKSAIQIYWALRS
jgi:hypothetical protein